MRYLQKHFFNLTILIVLTGVFVSLLFHNFFKNPFYYFAADNSELYFPFWVFINKTLHAGHFPLLNNYWFAGSLPFAAIESSVFYPPYLLFQLLYKAQNNLNNAYLFFFGFEILHYFIASIGFYFLLKVGLKLNASASIAGAIIYATTGSFIGRFVHVIVIFTMAWLPYLYCFYLKFIEKYKISYAAGVITSLFFIITSSHPQYTYYVFISFFILVVYSIITASRNERIRITLFSFILIVIACLLAAPKLLLTFELSQNIVHATLETSIKNLYNSLHPLYFLTLFVPYLFGKHQVGYWGSQYPWGNWENFIYIGIISFFFVFFSFGWKNKKLLFLFILHLLLSLLFLLGTYTPVSAFINERLPFSESLTMISKMTFLFHFTLCVLVAIGIQKFHEIFYTRKIIPIVLAVSLLFIGLLLIIFDNATLMRPGNRPIPSLLAQEFARQNIFLSFTLLGGLLSVIWLSILTKKKRILLLLIPLCMFDIYVNGGNFNPIESYPAPPSTYFGTNSVAQIIKNDNEIFRIHNLAPRNTNMVSGIESTYGYHTVETISYHYLPPHLNNVNMLNLMNVKYVLSDNSPGNNFKEVSPHIWLNATYMQRITIVPTYTLTNNNETALSIITKPDFNPTNEIVLIDNLYNRNVLQNFNIPINKTKDYAPPGSNPEFKKISSIKFTAKLKINNDSFLLFSQPNYPGWKATIDGKNAPLLSANAFEYALPIQKGSHIVEFFFESYPFKLGIIIQIVTLLLLSVLIGFFRILKNKNRGVIVYRK